MQWRRTFVPVAVAFLGGMNAACGSGNPPLPAPTYAYDQLDAPAHRYWERAPQDRFSRLKADLEAGRVTLDHRDEKAFVLSLLKALDIPPSSQLLLFSTTSLQISLISPANPRALYFRDDVYVGYIPRGRIEVISLDPELGGIFHIFDIPRGEAAPLPTIERSTRCMNCHAGTETGSVPGLLVKSVIPGPNRGSLLAFRDDDAGHHVPLSDRFGGWFLTGTHGLTNHWGNLTGRLFKGELTRIPIEPGATFELARYPVPTSDIFTHLILEHQTGFVNRVVEASYRARTLLHATDGALGAEAELELDEQARRLTRYILFADETPLPAGGIEPDPNYLTDFQTDRRTALDGSSLKDVDLRTRLLKHRCSYMIYSGIVEGLPGEMKRRLYRELQRALAPDAPVEFDYLPTDERGRIRAILKQTLPDLPPDW